MAQQRCTHELTLRRRCVSGSAGFVARLIRFRGPCRPGPPTDEAATREALLDVEQLRFHRRSTANVSGINGVTNVTIQSRRGEESTTTARIRGAEAAIARSSPASAAAWRNVGA
jgi:hypothetical protein